MSFQDVGRGKGRGTAGKGSTTIIAATNTGALSVGYISPKKTAVDFSYSTTTTTTSTSTSTSSATASTSLTSGTKMFVAVSDTILQYQRNVAILNNIATSILSGHNTNMNSSTVQEEFFVLNQQYTVQGDVIQQLGAKIERQLREVEVEMSSIRDRAEATQARNVHIKMTRDFRAVELAYKNLLLNVRQRKHFVDTRRQVQMQQQQSVIEDQVAREQMVLQVRREEDHINLQIMREREEEIRKINQGMITVNEIYKDLSNIVSEQQEDIDKVEMHMEQSNISVKQGLAQLEKANANADRQCVIS